MLPRDAVSLLSFVLCQCLSLTLEPAGSAANIYIICSREGVMPTLAILASNASRFVFICTSLGWRFRRKAVTRWWPCGFAARDALQTYANI